MMLYFEWQNQYSFQTCVGTFGIIGNIFIILVLSTNEMRNSFNHLLIVLSTFDILFIFFAILDYGMARGKLFWFTISMSFFCLLVFQWPFDFNSEWYAILFPKFLYPLNNIIFNCSIFLTIVIAYERWFLKTSYKVFCNFFLFQI